MALKLIDCEPPFELITKLRNQKLNDKKKKERAKKKKMINTFLANLHVSEKDTITIHANKESYKEHMDQFFSQQIESDSPKLTLENL